MQNARNPFLIILNLEQFPLEPKEHIWTPQYLDKLIELGEIEQSTDKQKVVRNGRTEQQNTN